MKKERVSVEKNRRELSLGMELRRRAQLALPGVGEISDALSLEQTAVSHNLKCLTFCGLAQSIGSGR